MPGKLFQRTYKNTKLIMRAPADMYFWSFITALVYLLCNNFVKRQYERLYNFFNGSEFLIIVIGFPTVMFVAYWFIGFWFTIIDFTQKPAFLTRYKHQPTKHSPLTYAQLKKCIRTVLFNQFLIIPFAVFNYVFIIRTGSLLRFRLEEWPTIFTLIVDLLVNSTSLEILFYYNHRIMHHPLLYQYIHKKHHEWTAPIAISFFYTHPVEHIFGILFPFLSGVYLRRSHIVSAWIWTVIAIAIGMNEHSGYHFPLMASTEFHEFHHTSTGVELIFAAAMAISRTTLQITILNASTAPHFRFNQNYGLFGLMDHIHKTDKVFRRSIAYRRHFCYWSSTPQTITFPEVVEEHDKSPQCHLPLDHNENLCANKRHNTRVR